MQILIFRPNINALFNQKIHFTLFNEILYQTIFCGGVVQLSHLSDFNCDSTENNTQCSLSAVSVESAWSLRGVAKHCEYEDCAETALRLTAMRIDSQWNRQSVKAAL